MKTDLFEMVDMDYLFTVITADRAVEYTGKEVYVANSITALEKQIKEGTTRTLEGINSTLCELRFNVHNDDCTTSAYALCVPADKVIKHEKHLRPFKDRAEFKEVTGLKVGDTILFREKKSDPDCSDEAFILSLANVSEGCMLVTFGGIRTSNQILFDKCEYSKDEGETWLPFGVEE